MNDYDYVVLFDENGQPYIAHSLWDRAKQVTSNARNTATTAANRAHKYIEKIKEGGKTLYFYTQDELRAHYNNARNTANTAVNRARDTTRNTANRAREKAREALGYNAHARYEKAWDRTSAARDKFDANPDSIHAERALERAEANEARAHDEYLRTPLGRARDAVSRVQEITSEAKDRAKDVVDSTRNRASDAVDNVKNRARDAVDNVKERSGYNARQRYNQSVQNVKGYNEAVNSDSAIKQDMALRSREQIQNEHIAAVNNYKITPLGKIEGTAAAAGQAAKGVAALAAATGLAVASIPVAAVSLLAAGSFTAAVVAAKCATYKVGELYNGAKQKAATAINSAKNAVTNATNSIREQVKQFGAKVTGNKLVLPSGKQVTIPEQYIRENTIPESFIQEKILEENILNEKYG